MNILEMLNNIKSKIILEKIFNCMKKKIKMKILKCNKVLLNKLNISIKDFKETEVFKEFKKTFNEKDDIEDITKLNLKKKIKNIEAFKYFNQINFFNLKELYLNKNNLKEINLLSNAKFIQLEILNLGENKLADINALEKIELN